MWNPNQGEWPWGWGWLPLGAVQSLGLGEGLSAATTGTLKDYLCIKGEWGIVVV